MQKRINFLRHIHYFRGFAIVNIVFVHTLYVPSSLQDYPGAAFIDVFREVAFHASTIYFLFISGFLFFHLSGNFNINVYYKKKFLNVILPYSILTILIVISENFSSIVQSEIPKYYYIKKIIWSLFYGKAKFQYWYIPFISLVFIVSPLLLKIPKNTFKNIVLFSLLMPLFGTRTGITISIWQYAYFFPIYMLGIFAAMNYDSFISAIKNEQKKLIIIAITSTIILVFLHQNNLKFRMINISEAVYYIQKLSICFLCINILAYYEEKKIILLDYLAKYSFAIYFTHTMVSSKYIVKIYNQYFFQELPGLIVPLSILYSIAIIFSSLLVCMIAKKILGKHSRYFVGA